MKNLWLFVLLLVLPAWPQTARPVVGEVKQHVVKEGESVFTVARDYGLAVDHVAFANGYPVTSIVVEPGTTLLIPNRRVLPANPPRNGLVLNLPERGLYFFKKGQFQRFIPVSIGDEEGFSTPPGSYSIIEKIKNPTWYPPAWAEEKKPVPPGPKNPLGDRWIGLSLTRTGIHGTNQPLNVGNSVTHGCIRAYPEMVRKLYDEVAVGWPVRIEYETAKLGRDTNGQLLLVTFPDVYGLSDPLQASRRLLEKAGLGDRLGRGNLKDILALTLGFPVNTVRHQTVWQEVAR